MTAHPGGEVGTDDMGILSDEFVETYIRQLSWSAEADDYARTLVAGNIRGFAQAIRAHLLDVANTAIQNAQIVAAACGNEGGE